MHWNNTEKKKTRRTGLQCFNWQVDDKTTGIALIYRYRLFSTFFIFVQAMDCFPMDWRYLKKKITQLLCNYSYHFQLFQFLFFKYMVCKSLPSNFIHVSCSFNYKYYCSRTNILHITAKCFNNTILTLQSFTATRRFTRV